MEFSEIETTAESIDSSVMFHIINDLLGFLLYMHQQIPSILQDMSLEFDVLKSEYKELEVEVAKDDMRASARRRCYGRMREIKQGTRRLEKLMNSVSGIRAALQLIISENPDIPGVTLILGSSPLRPQYVYELCFLHGKMSPRGATDYHKCRAAEVLSRKAIRFLISKGAGSSSYPGSTKLFILVKAPPSFHQPLHFLPKRDFRYNKKIVPYKLQFKCRSQPQDEIDKLDHPSLEGSSCSSKEGTTDDFIWFQCRHVIKGLAFKPAEPEE